MTQLPEGFEKVEKNPKTEPLTSFKELPEGFEKVEKITELPEDFVKEDDLSIDEIKKMQSEGVKLSEKLQRKLFEAEDERGLLDKAAGAASAFLPAAADIIGQTASGAVELANKAVVQPAVFALSGGYNRLDSEEAKKVFKDREEALRSLAVGAAKDVEETANAAVRAIYFGTGVTDKLLGKSKEERFRRWQDRQTMRDLEAQSLEETPDRAAYLLSQNPLIQGYVEYEAKKMGLSPEEVEKVKQDYIQTMLDQGLTKEQINQNIAALGEFVSPVAIPGGGRLSDAALKPLAKVTAPVINKASELAVRGTSKLAQGTEYAANKVLQGTELLQTGARKIGEYAINDPDTWIKGTVNTAIMPVVGVAKPVSATARVIRDITNIDIGGTAGRKGMVEMAGQRIDSSDLTKRLFGTQGKGGVARAKLADWTIRQSNALIQPGVNAAAMNVVMGLPDIETAEDLGFTAGTGFGIGSLAGVRSYDRLSGLVDPRKTMAEKITNFVTPDPAAYRRDEDADIKRFMAQATPDIQQNITDLADIEKRKAAVDATIASLEKERDAQIDPEDAAFKQAQIDGFLKQKEALSKATPETQAEVLRQTQLAFIDAYDLAQSTGGVAGLRGVKIAVLDPANAEQFFRDLYGDSLKQAETTINLLTGIPSLTETDSQKLTEARQLLQKFQNDVEGAKSTRGFAIQEDNTDPDSKDFVPPHLRRINQQGATAVINADLIKHLSSQGFNIRHTLQHEVQHAVQQFAEVNKMLAPLRGQLFDQKIRNDDGTTEVYQQGIFSDEDLDRYATKYAKLMSPSDNGASFYAQFGGEVEKMRAYIKDEILAETAAATGEYAGGTRASLDDVGRNVMDWLEVKTKSGRLKQLKEALRRNGVIFDNVGAVSSVLDAQMSPETLAMVRQYQRGLKDFDGTMTVQQSRESDEPDIPLTKVLGSVALQNKYRHADFFEKEQIIKATAPDGSVTEIVIPKEAKIDPFIDVYRTQGGQLVDANGNVVTLGPEITFGSMPDGTTFEVDTRIARKSNGSPIILTNREMKSRALERTKMIQNAIDSAKDDGSGVRLSDTGNGNYRGVMSPAQIEAFMALPNNVVSPNLKRMTKFFNELMARNDGTRVVMEYQASLLNGKYKALSPKIRDEVPIGFQLTKDGNFALTTISVSRLYDKMQAWADKKPANLQPWNGDTGAFWDSVTKYLDNHAKGEKGETGLNPDAYIASKMKNKINDLFNAYNAETKQSNPERSTLPRARGKDNLDIVIRSRRLDRINNFSESPSQKLPINYGYLTTNYMPAVNPMAAPMTAEEVQNRFDGSVTATRVRRAMATGEIDALESELRQMDDLLPTESLQLVQGEDQMPRIQIVSMFDPENVASLEPEEIVSDIDAETEAELAILDAQDGTVPPQDIAKVLSSKLDQLYADGGRSPIIPALETELEKINQQLELQAQEQAAATMQAEEATQAAEEVTPVTQFMPAEAPSGERGFKSKLQMEIQRNFKGARATPEQLKSVLGNPQNVKPEEVKWSGVMDEIDRLAQENNGKVPVQELMNYLRNEGQVKFDEVTLGEDRSIKDVADRYRIKIEKQFGEAAFYDEFDEPLEFDELPVALQDAIDKAEKKPEPKYAQYQLPGGENYREVVLSMPPSLSRQAKQITDKYGIPYEESSAYLLKEKGANPEEISQYTQGVEQASFDPTFTSSHFPDVPNYIAHMRVNERTDAEGNEGLFVEEFQSDRHQQGREKGYKEDLNKDRLNELANKGVREITKDEQEELRNLLKQRDALADGGIPDAPFRKDWGVQLFKRALRDAVESGKSWIGWTTGDTQAERYDLSKQIGKVVWNEDTKMLTAYDPSQKRAVIQESNITSGKLADYVGKEVAQKLVEQSPDEDMDRQISGLDLKVGGEGMKGFYDQILPKEIGKYVDKMGGKVEKSEIETKKEYTIVGNPNFSSTMVFDTNQLASEMLANRGRNEGGKVIERKDISPIWRVNITPEMETVVRTGQMQFMPAVAVVPERFTGNAEDERRGRYVAPPAFFKQFDIGEYQKGGKFFDSETGEEITDKTYSTGTIDVTGKTPSLVSEIESDQLGEGKTWKTNLFKKSAGWNWISDNPPEVASIGKSPVLISVEGGKDHFYTLKADFQSGVKLQRYSDKPSEPRLRPTAKGEIQFGNEIGRIKTAQKEHPVYDTITIGTKFMPAENTASLSDVRIPDAIAKGSGEFAVLRQALQGVEAPVMEPAKTPEVPKQQEIPVAKTEDTEDEVADTELISTGIDVPESVDEQSVISNAIKLANSQPWKKGRDFKLDIQGKVRAAAEKAGVTISKRTAEAIEYLTRVGLKDGLIALEQNPNAIGWYDEKTKQALAVMSLLFPEIGKDENARFAFTWALAVTSNGLKVDKNFELAERVYREYRKTGKMPNNIQAGQAQKAINKSLDLFNQLTKEWGIDNTRKFMQTDFTVGEISRLGVVSKADKKEVKPGGEFSDTIVRGSAILGPKIGNGFFSNLYGLFDALTMDRWLVRTWGRWTGTLVELNPELTQISKTRLEETLEKLTPEDKARMDEMIGQDISQMSTEDLSLAIQKASMKPALREVMNTTPTGEEFRKAGNSLAKYLDGQKEAPANPAERNFIREIFGLMLDELKANPKYKDLTMADLQAVLWYAEKRLYETAKVKSDQDDIDSEDADGYEDDEAPDYANAAIGVARKQGISENRINKVLQKIKNERATTTRLADEGRSDIETEQQKSAGGFTGKEKQKFRQYVAVTTTRRNRTGNEKALWSYARKSGSDSGDAGVLKPKSKKNLGVKYISEWKAGRKLATMFRNNGLPSVKFLELDSTDKASAQKFADTLQKSKNASVNGAAVYVYPVEDYQGMKLFLSESGQSGFALKPDGDIVSVFSMDKGSGRSIMETAIAAGGKKLDAFDTILPEFYGTHGFVEAARIPWNDEYAPEGWDKETFKDFNNGEPDVVMMVLDPKFEGEYEPRTDIYATDYDQAVAMQNSLLKKIEKASKKK